MAGRLKRKKLVPRRINPQNIVYRLYHREHNICEPGTNFHAARQFYTNIFPNLTVVNIEKPSCFLRKFSPDGEHFVAFSFDQTSLEIFRFRGPTAAEEVLTHVSGEHYGEGTDILSAAIRNQLFDLFFQHMHSTSVSRYPLTLNRECSLFTDNGKFVIVGAAANVPNDTPPYFYNIYTNNESVTPNARFPLEDYTVHIVELETGRLCDSRSFKCDKILLPHNQGLYLFKDILAILSIQHQMIHVYKILPDGSFMDIRSIGRFCYEDDLMYVSAVPNAHGARPYSEPFYSSLKHRFLVYLFKRAKYYAETEGDRSHLRKFYQYFDQLRTLKVWKMQLLDEEHLLLKYTSEDVVVQKTVDPNTQPAFFVVYNMTTTQVIGAYENSSEQLLVLFENFCDIFRNATREGEVQFPCSPSSNISAKQIHARFKQTIISAKFGGETEAVKRLLSQLPISAQSYSSSPYFDLALFSYDDKWISVMERPKACGDYPIRFFARDSGLLKFRIHAGLVGRNLPPNSRRLVAFTFHPFYPFAISVQRTNSDYVVNFHIRHCPV